MRHGLDRLGVDNESQKDKDQTEAGTAKRKSPGRVAFTESTWAFLIFRVLSSVHIFEAALRCYCGCVLELHNLGFSANSVGDGMCQSAGLV